MTFLIEKYNKHDRSCYGKTLRTVTQQIVPLAGTESHHYNHMNKKEHGGIRRRRSRMRKMTFLHEKSIKTSDSFCKTHNEMMIATATIHTCLGGEASLVPFVMQRCSWWEVAGGGRGGTWWGTQVGYTSFLRGPSQKAAMAHFHIENHVEKWDSDDKKAILITERISDENMSGQEMAKIRRGNLESVIKIVILLVTSESGTYFFHQFDGQVNQ
jgi:hypothetical protein